MKLANQVRRNGNKKQPKAQGQTATGKERSGPTPEPARAIRHGTFVNPFGDGKNGTMRCDNPDLAADYWRRFVATDERFDPEREHFVVLILNTRRNVKGHDLVSVGTLDTIHVHPREVFVRAVKQSASAIIIMHNHPSGDTSPSETDVNVTRGLQRAAAVMKMELLDHVIIGRATAGRARDYASLRELGYFTGDCIGEAALAAETSPAGANKADDTSRAVPPAAQADAAQVALRRLAAGLWEAAGELSAVLHQTAIHSNSILVLEPGGERPPVEDWSSMLVVKSLDEDRRDRASELTHTAVRVQEELSEAAHEIFRRFYGDIPGQPAPLRVVEWSELRRRVVNAGRKAVLLVNVIAEHLFDSLAGASAVQLEHARDYVALAWDTGEFWRAASARFEQAAGKAVTA